jgi:hypothetical protein
MSNSRQLRLGAFMRFRECASYEVLLAVVMTCEGVRAHYGPIHVFSYIFEESCAVALFETLEDFSNTFGCDSHFELGSSLISFRPRYLTQRNAGITFEANSSR